MTPTDKENSQPKPEKRDIKKMIPRLRLEMLPNYHAKAQTTTTTSPNNENLNKTYTSSSQNILKAQMQKAFSNASGNPLSEYNPNNMSSNYLKV